MITKIIAQEVVIKCDATKLLLKVNAKLNVLSTLYDGIQIMDVEITDKEALASFKNAEKDGKAKILSEKAHQEYTEWVKTYAREIEEVYAGEVELKKVVGNDVIFKVDK